MDRRDGLRVESLEDRLAPAIVLVNPAGNTPNGTYAAEWSGPDVYTARVAGPSNPDETRATNPSNG